MEKLKLKLTSAKVEVEVEGPYLSGRVGWWMGCRLGGFGGIETKTNLSQN